MDAHGHHAHVGGPDLRGDGYAHAAGNVRAPDVQHHHAQENVIVNPKIVDVHTGNIAGSMAGSGWFSSALLDIESERKLLDFTYYMIIGAAIVVYVLLHFLPSAYGRYASRAFGILIPARIAWFLQDLPAVVIPLWVFFNMEHTQLHLANYILLAMFVLSYAQRALVYPVLINGGKPVPSVPFLSALVYNSVNGYFQARYLTRFAYYGPLWLITVNFIAGAIMFGLGLGINWQSDSILRSLRSPLSRARGDVHTSDVMDNSQTVGEVFDKDAKRNMHKAGPGGPMPTGSSASRSTGNDDRIGYKIPRGGMFEFVSCANFFGEIVEWWGFAYCAWSLPAVAHAIFTTANLVPRALQHHQDYLLKFKDSYPKNRAAVIPYIL